MIKGKRVLVTGSEGFLGKHLVQALIAFDCKDVFTVLHKSDPGQGCDLTQKDQVTQMFKNVTVDAPLDWVFHLAGYNGGIQFNLEKPGDIFYQNTVMGLNVLRACAQNTKISKVISVVASCAYPAVTYNERWSPVQGRAMTEAGVCNEENFFDGMPDPSVACHGLAKRNLQLASQFYNQQYELEAVCACPTTIYGPGDSFNPQRTKVMSGMVKRFVDARREKAPFVTVWGSGTPMREFIYVKDCVDLLIRTAVFYTNCKKPLNLGTGQEITIADLAEKVATLVGYQGEIRFDRSRPDGQFRKRLDLGRMRRTLGRFPQPTPLDVGIMETIRYYEENF